MARRLMIIGGILILLLAFSQILLPLAVSDVIGAAMTKLTSADKVEARADKSPAIMMLAGNFDTISVKATGAKTDKVVFDEFDINLSNINVDMGSLIQNRTLTMKSVEDITVKAVISEAELARTINQTVKGAKNAEVSITPEKVTATSVLSMGGLVNAKVILEGKFISTDHTIIFHTEHFQVNNSIMGKFGGALLTDITLIDLKKLPFDVTVKNITLEQGRAVVYAESHR
ncbi:MAG: hypothetical protein K0Q53_1811 [Massilibacillus sp.]|nr:hypothetical protein [Massilibacillus sp.]